MFWARAILGGILAELLVVVLIAPVALVVGLDTLNDPAHLPAAIRYGVVIGSFIGPALLTQWVTRPATSRFVLHGIVVGTSAFLLYMIPMAASGESQPLIYWVAHAIKVLGGATGGYVAGRRPRVPAETATA